MKNLIKVIIGMSLSATLSAAAASEEMDTTKATQSTYDVLKTCKTVGDLYKKMDPKLASQLRQKLKGGEAQTISVTRVGKNKLLFEVGSSSASLAFLGGVEGGTQTEFLINGKEFEFNRELSPEKQINEIAKLLPKQISWMSIVFPEAYADDGSSFSPMLMMAAVMMFAMMSNRNEAPPPMPWYGGGGYRQQQMYGRQFGAGRPMMMNTGGAVSTGPLIMPMVASPTSAPAVIP